MPAEGSVPRQGWFITVSCAHPRHRGDREWLVTRYMGTGDDSPVKWIEVPGSSHAWRAERKRPSPDRNPGELSRVSDKPGHRFTYQHGVCRPLSELLDEYGQPRDSSAPIENRVILWCDRCARAGKTPELRCPEPDLWRLLDLLHAAGRKSVTIRELIRAHQQIRSR